MVVVMVVMVAGQVIATGARTLQQMGQTDGLVAWWDEGVRVRGEGYDGIMFKEWR